MGSLAKQPLNNKARERMLTVNCHKRRLHFEESGVCISKKMLSPSGRRNVVVHPRQMRAEGAAVDGFQWLPGGNMRLGVIMFSR